MRIILASQSPRRRELLDLLKVEYEVIPSKAEEKKQEGLAIVEQAKQIAYTKAKDIFNRTSGDRIVIGADTIVVKDGQIYEKPKDNQDAVRILNELNNDVHQVITGLCIIIQSEGKFKQYLDYDITDVYFKEITQDEILEWVNTGKASDKAGAYAIQSEFGVHINKIEGNYSTVVGLPIHKLYDVIKEYI